MGKIAFVFPGQGSQAVGMGMDAYEAQPEARAIFDAADEALGFSLSSLIAQGPAESLNQTINTQPALLTTSMAYLEVLKRTGMTPDYVAGHSLGEYSALVAAGVLSFEDAVKLVRARGQFMEEAVPGGQGAMAAVIGAEREALSALCDSITAAGDLVELANVNCSGQIVISGSRAGVQTASERVKEAGGKRAIMLEVSGPFHSSLMKEAASRIEERLGSVAFHTPTVPVVANVTAQAVTDGEAFRRLLVEQVYSPVLWEDTVKLLVAEGVDTLVEIGPGSVLTGLARKIDRSLKVITINSLESVSVHMPA